MGVVSERHKDAKPDCPCCNGRGVEVVLHEPNGWKTIYYCICCVGGGTRTVGPRQPTKADYERGEQLALEHGWP